MYMTSENFFTKKKFPYSNFMRHSQTYISIYKSHVVHPVQNDRMGKRGHTREMDFAKSTSPG